MLLPRATGYGCPQTYDSKLVQPFVEDDGGGHTLIQVGVQS